MLTIIAAGLAATTIAAVVNKLSTRNVKVVVKPVVFTENRTFSTPSHIYRRMEADRQAHMADFARRVQQ